MGHGGVTTTGPDATHPQLSFKIRRGGGQLGGVQPGVRGGRVFLPGVWPGVMGVSSQG